MLQKLYKVYDMNRQTFQDLIAMGMRLVTCMLKKPCISWNKPSPKMLLMYQVLFLALKTLLLLIFITIIIFYD